MNMLRTLLLCAATASLQMLPLAHAGTIVVSGDMTPVFALTNTTPNLAVAGNGSFFSNLLGSGDGVAIMSTGNNAFAPTELDEFYSALPGVSANILSSTITATTLAGVDLFVAPSPSRAFTSAEIATLSAFLQTGGTLFVMGEAQGIPFGASTNVILNNLLTGLGSSMSLLTSDLDFGAQTAVGSQIAADPYTAGVTSFAYGFASTVVGGTALFRSTGGVTFTAYSASVVPEPATMLLFGAGVGLLGLVLRRRR